MKSKVMSDQEKRINDVLSNCADQSVSQETLEAFFRYLNEILSFPCEVVGKADLVRYTLCGVENSGDEMYGLLARLTHVANEKQECVIPLCDLKAVDNRSLEFALIHDYATWFVNSQF